MDRRSTRTRGKRADDSVSFGKTKRGSSASNSSPRRSSRPRSTLGAPILTTSGGVSKSSPIKEENERKSATKSPKTTTKSATTIKARPEISPLKISVKKSPTPQQSEATKSSVKSYSSVKTQRTIEIKSASEIPLNQDIKKLADYIRRSVSRTIAGAGDEAREDTHTPTTNAETESRYSRSLSRSVYDDDNYSKTEFSDEEPETQQEINTAYKNITPTAAAACRQLNAPRAFGGWLSALLLLILAPSLIYYTQWTCSKSGCVFKPVNVTNLLDVQQVITRVANKSAMGAFFLYNYGIFILAAILFGRHTRVPFGPRGMLEYKFNTLPTAIVVLIAAAIGEYFKYGVADFILKHYLRFCIYGFVNAFVFSLWCYWRIRWSSKVDNAQLNVYGNTGNFIIDYAQGRQINPKWLGVVEYKQVFYSISLISTLLVSLCFIYKNVQIPWLPVGKEGIWNIITFYGRNIKYDGTTILAASLVVLYVLDAIIFEHHLASSFELQGEGFGCLLMLRYAATPYLLNAVPKYFFERHLPINCQYAIYVGLILLSAGLILKRLSNAVKYKYRINPLHPLFYGIETIHTYQGKRLLLGSLWGRLRQPNYAGDIIALSALTVPLFLRFAWPPLVSILLLIVLLLHRTVRVNARNQSRYHSSWVQYCNRVRYYVLPKVF